MAEMTSEEFAKARARGAARMRGPRAESAHYDAPGDRIVVRLLTGVEVGVKRADLQGLEHASAEDLETVAVEAFGLGIYFPTLDVDIYVPTLVRGVFGSSRWMETRANLARGQGNLLPRRIARFGRNKQIEPVAGKG